MKILFISLFLPQEKAYHAGGRYVFEMIRGLSEAHEIHLVTRLEENELPHLESLRPFCKAIHPYTYHIEGRKSLLSMVERPVGRNMKVSMIQRRSGSWVQTADAHRFPTEIFPTRSVSSRLPVRNENIVLPTLIAECYR